jgi:hypothetical protein
MNKELLDDTSFDREVVPKDQEGDLLVSLLKAKAFDMKSAIGLAKYPISEESIDRLIKEERVIAFSENPMKIYLTPMGKIIAGGEFAIRRNETRTFNLMQELKAVIK